MLSWILIGFVLTFSSGNSHSDRVCAHQSTLDALVSCIVEAMPREASEGFIIPSDDTQNDWRQVIAEMLAGGCEAITVPASLLDVYTIAPFTDGENNQSYCVLREVADINADGVVDRGWGTFIINRMPRRNIDFSIPHPLNDSNTGRQGIGLFKSSGARTFTMAGAHRRANAAISSCQDAFHVADAAHNSDIFFHHTLEVLRAYYDGSGEAFNSLQFHGMGTRTCPGVDVYLTHGSSALVPVDGDPIFALQANLIAQQPAWVVTVPGDVPTCSLSGTTNVQGRLLNNVAPADVCTSGATDSDVTGAFIHIEQKFDHRAPADWAKAINETFPELQSVGSEESQTPSANLLKWNVYPNPFEQSSTIQIQLVESEDVSLVLYDTLGRQLRNLYTGRMYASQTYRIRLNRETLSGGHYTLWLKGVNLQESQSILITP